MKKKPADPATPPKDNEMNVEMIPIYCPTCGVMFSLPTAFAEMRMDARGVGCPNRHDLWYDQSRSEWVDRAARGPRQIAEQTDSACPSV